MNSGEWTVVSKTILRGLLFADHSPLTTRKGTEVMLLTNLGIYRSNLKSLYFAHCEKVRKRVHRRAAAWLRKIGHEISECKSKKKGNTQKLASAIRIAWNRGWLKDMPIRQCEVDILGLRAGTRIGDPLVEVRRSDPKPCKALPGTREKIDEIERRYWAGEELWHEQDGPNLAHCASFAPYEERAKLRVGCVGCAASGVRTRDVTDAPFAQCANEL